MLFMLINVYLLQNFHCAEKIDRINHLSIIIKKQLTSILRGCFYSYMSSV